MAIQDISNLAISASFQQLLQISGSKVGTATGTQIDSLDISASFADNADNASNADIAQNSANAISASHAIQADSASIATTAITASHALNTVDTGSLLKNASINDATITFLKGDASTFAITVDNVDTASIAISSSHAVNSDSAISASHALSSNTAISASHAVNADTAISSSHAATAISASHALKSDLAHDANDLIVTVKNTGVVPIAKGNVLHATGVTGENINVELADNTIAASMPGFAVANEAISVNSSGQAIVSGKITGISTLGLTAGDNVYVNASGGFTGTKPTGSALIQNIGIVGKVNATEGELLILGAGRSNDLPNIAEDYLWVGNSNGVPQAIDKDALTVGTASLALDVISSANLNVSSISASSAVFTSASIGYLESITGSAKIIGDAFIIVNNDTPVERYAGLAVYDSGSANNTSSFAYDGQTDDWFFEKDVTGSAHFGVALFGPEYATKGAPAYITQNRVPKGVGDHHLEDSNISDNGSKIVLGSDVEITGSLGITGAIAGSITSAISASHAINADLALTANTASYVAAANIDGTVATATSASHAVNADSAISASHALQANSATSASRATSAASADTAVSSSHALSANTAISASHALIADNAPYINSLYYPTSDGTDGQVITTDGAGTLTFTDIADDPEVVDNSTDTYATSATCQHIITLSQAEYDAITTPDANTLYIII